MYFEPEMEVINLKLQGMLCASGDVAEETGEAPISNTEIYLVQISELTEGSIPNCETS